MRTLLERYLPLESNSSGSTKLFEQRQKDHYSHFILRLAFASTEDLRRRFCRVESMLFRLRFNSDSHTERSAFVSGLDLDWWEPVTDDERLQLAGELAAVAGNKKGSADVDEGWFKVDWMRVPELEIILADQRARKVGTRRGAARVARAPGGFTRRN